MKLSDLLAQEVTFSTSTPEKWAKAESFLLIRNNPNSFTVSNKNSKSSTTIKMSFFLTFPWVGFYSQTKKEISTPLELSFKFLVTSWFVSHNEIRLTGNVSDVTSIKMRLIFDFLIFHFLTCQRITPDREREVERERKESIWVSDEILGEWFGTHNWIQGLRE